jgi:hypothetical protein
MLRNLRPYPVQILQKNVPDCRDNPAAIMLLLKTWFDIYNSAFFGGSLRPLRDQLRLADRLPWFNGLLAGLVGTIGELDINRYQYNKNYPGGCQTFIFSLNRGIVLY